jgi:hypothetical protein
VNDNYRVRALFTDGTYSPYTNIVTLSNCVAVSGTGPDKVVFMRGQSAALNNLQFLSTINDSISNGFNSVEPFKTYFSSFSFYEDLRTADETGFSGGLYYAYRYVPGLSSCGSVAKSFAYFLNPNTASDFAGVTSGTTYNANAFKSNQSSVMEVNLYGASASDVSRTLMHEAGHAFGLLDDEYQGGGFVNMVNNCSMRPWTDYVGLDNLMYGAGPGSGTAGCADSSYYRPSSDSIMMGGYSTSRQFNIYDCGAVIAGILNIQDAPIANVYPYMRIKKYFPQCNAMAVAGSVAGASEIPPRGTQPTVNGISPSASGSPGLTYDVKGSGFTLANNSVKLTPVPKTSFAPVSNQDLPANAYSMFDVLINMIKAILGISIAHGQTATTDGTAYIINGIPSADGASLTFTVPTSTPLGSYTVSVGASNSPWTDTGTTIGIASVPVLSISSMSNAAGASLSWTDPDTNVKSFSVLTSPGSVLVATTSGTVKTYIDKITPIYPSTSYCYAVQAVIGQAAAPTSAVKCATSAQAVPPTSFTARVSSTQVTLTWNNSARFYNYVSIERSLSSGSGFSQIATATSTSYMDKGLKTSTVYYYRVRTLFNNGSYSPYSTTLAPKTGSAL